MVSIDIRFPNITGRNEAEQLTQIKSYLYQFAEQLQWAFNTIEKGTSSESVVLQDSKGNEMQETEEAKAYDTFNSIKDLIIKSADIVEAYSEQIDNLLNLSGTYVAQSDFGTFSEETNNKISADSTRIDNLFTNLQEITDTLDGVGESLVEVTANIRTGLLDTDENGIPVYGIEVGQENTVDGVKVFNKFARFTADRLSFYDQNDNEVAYISDYKLYITHAIIGGSLTLGGIRSEVNQLDGSVVRKWVGWGGNS